MATIVIPFNAGGRSGIYPGTAITRPSVGFSVGGKSGVDFQVQVVSQAAVTVPGAGGRSGASFNLRVEMPRVIPAAFTSGSRSGASFGAQVSWPVSSAAHTPPAGGRSGVSMGMVVNTPHALVIPFVAGGLSGVDLFPAQPEDYETWVLNDNGFAPAAYTNWNFNSYAQYRGQYYAAGEAGLYLLGGPDQDGEEIHPGVRLSPVNFGTSRQKRVRSLRLGVTGRRVLVRLATERGVDGTFVLQDQKIPVSRDIQGKEWTIDIGDFQELSFMEIVPLILCN